MRLSFLVESPILYLAFFKTILAALFRAFGLPLSFLPSKPSFLHDHSTTQHSNVSSFLAISTTDKSVNRSIQAYALTQLNVFCVKGVYLSWYSQKTRKEFEQFGLWNTKNMWLENVLAHAWKYWIILKGTTSVEIIYLPSPIVLECRLIKYVAERTFGTPCNYMTETTLFIHPYFYSHTCINNKI